MVSKLACPGRLCNSQGNTRRVGIELEFAGLDLKQAAQVLASALPGHIEEDTRAECRVRHAEWGEFKIELDWTFAKNVARRHLEQGNASEDALIGLMTDLARQIVPLEVVCPPIEWNRLNELDPVIGALRKAGALGTSDSLIYAFGLHINPELPALDATTLLAYLQAYCLAQDWLVKANRVDPVRRLTPYVDGYSRRYIQQVLTYSPDVTLSQVIDDYLAHNPTRNRGMDLLPLFKYLDEPRVLAAIRDERVNARPTFHYRLPNCEIEKPGWGLAPSWNLWCVVEHLAADASALASLRSQAILYYQNLINLQEEPWHPELARIHDRLLSV